MRQIEKNMNSAIWSKKNWAGSNTTVITEGNESTVMLHGNHIATYYHDTKELTFNINSIYLDPCSSVFVIIVVSPIDPQAKGQS